MGPRVHRAWLYATVVASVLLLFTLGTSAYQIIDLSVTIHYYSESILLQQDQIEILGRLAPEILGRLAPELHRGRSQQDIVALLRELYPGGFIAEGQSTVSFKNLSFLFDEHGLLAGIERM